MAILGKPKTTWVLGKDSVLDYVAAGPNECWIWTASLNIAGYGTTRVKIDGRWRSRSAHRLAYEELVGPIPPGLVIDHLCRVRRCINPRKADDAARKRAQGRLARDHYPRVYAALFAEELAKETTS